MKIDIKLIYLIVVCALVFVKGAGATDPLSPPTGVTASDGTYTDKVLITWAASSGATAYDIFRAEKPVFLGGVPEKIGTTSFLYFTDRTADGGIYNIYWVKARNVTGGSFYSLFDTGYRGTLAEGSVPTPPRLIRASDGKYKGFIEVTWMAPNHAEFYDVYRRLESQAYKKIGSTDKTFYHDTDVICGVKYQYNVKAVNAYGTSGLSSYADEYPDSGTRGGCPPLPPERVSASDSHDPDEGMIYIDWSYSSQATSYDIYRATQPGAADDRTKNATVNQTYSGLYYEDYSAECGVTYYYWLRAKNEYGVSDFSAYDTGRRGTCELPSAPTDVIATKGIYYPGKVFIKWNRSSIATLYDIYRSTEKDNSSSMMKIGTTSATRFIDDGIVYGESYYYRIRATNYFGESDFSNYSIGYSFKHIQDDAGVETKLDSDDNQDNFGQSVAIYGDNILVGADGDDENGSNAGAAYIYERFRDGNWSETTKLFPVGGEQGHNFGISVALFDDIALVGAEGSEYSGAAYIFERETDGSWPQVAKLLPQKRFSHFGKSVALFGNIAMVGAHRDNNTGAVYVYERRPEGTWELVQRLKASDVESGGRFGYAVALQENRAIIGALDSRFMYIPSGKIYIFEKDHGGLWEEIAKVEDPSPRSGFGSVVAVCDDTCFAGAPYDGDNGVYSGAVYVFQRSFGNEWSQTYKVTASDGTDWDEFGCSLSAGNDVVTIGACGDSYFGSNSGAVYLFEKKQSGVWKQRNKLMASDRTRWKYFGQSVSISDDFVITGARSSAYIYDLSASELSEPVNVSASDGEYEDKIRISWKEVPNATYYDVYRAEKRVIDGGTIVKLMSTSDTFYDDISVPCDIIYYYWVKSRNVIGTSKFSKFDTGVRNCR